MTYACLEFHTHPAVALTGPLNNQYAAVFFITLVVCEQLPAWGLWLLWQYVLQPYFFSRKPEVSLGFVCNDHGRRMMSLHLTCIGSPCAQWPCDIACNLTIECCKSHT